MPFEVVLFTPAHEGGFRDHYYCKSLQTFDSAEEAKSFRREKMKTIEKDHILETHHTGTCSPKNCKIKNQLDKAKESGDTDLVQILSKVVCDGKCEIDALKEGFKVWKS